MFLCKLLIIFLITRKCHSYYHIQKLLEHKNIDVLDALKEVLNSGDEHLHKKDLFITVWYDQQILEYRNIFHDLVNGILEGLNKEHIVNVKFHKQISFKANPHYQLILVDDFVSFSNLYKNLTRTRNLSYTLIYFSAIKALQDPQIIKALKLLWQLHVINVGLIVPTPVAFNQSKFAMITYFPYEPHNCERVRPRLVNHFNVQLRSWEIKDFFPKKLNNFNRCPIIGATWEDMPYLQAKRKPNGQVYDLIGLEGNLLKFIAENLNFTLEICELNDDQKLATFNETGWIFETPKAKVPFSQSKYYFVSSIYLVVNNMHRQIRFEVLVRPIQMQVWLMIGLLFVVGYVVIFALRHGRRIGSNATTATSPGYGFIIGHRTRAPYYNMFVTFLGGQMVGPLPGRNFARYLLILWLLSTLVLRAAYQSGLFEILRDQRTEEPPHTLNEVVARNYVIEMLPENERILAILPEVKQVRFFNRTNELQAFLKLAETAERTAVLTPYEYFGHFRKMNQSISRSLSLVRECIFTQPLSFYVQRNSFLVHLLDEQISWAQNYGFTELWERQYIAERLESELGTERRAGGKMTASAAGRAMRHSDNGKADDIAETHAKFNILSWHELDAIFHLCGYLLLFACGIFVAELVIAKFQMTAHK